MKNIYMSPDQVKFLDLLHNAFPGMHLLESLTHLEPENYLDLFSSEEGTPAHPVRPQDDEAYIPERDSSPILPSGSATPLGLSVSCGETVNDPFLGKASIAPNVDPISESNALENERDEDSYGLICVNGVMRGGLFKPFKAESLKAEPLMFLEHLNVDSLEKASIALDRDHPIPLEEYYGDLDETDLSSVEKIFSILDKQEDSIGLEEAYSDNDASPLFFHDGSDWLLAL